MTPAIETEIKEFLPGTTGWSADDLNEPAIERAWERGHYEIVEGVLTNMAAAHFEGGLCLGNLVREIYRYCDRENNPGKFGFEADLIASPRRVVRVDSVFVTPADLDRQAQANATHPRYGRRKLKFGRFLVPPTLIIESVSIGHESHDRETKRTWYTEFGVPNYWIIDGYEQALECLVLRDRAYVIDQSGSGDQILSPALFPGLQLSLGKLWA